MSTSLLTEIVRQFSIEDDEVTKINFFEVIDRITGDRVEYLQRKFYEANVDLPFIWNWDADTLFVMERANLIDDLLFALAERLPHDQVEAALKRAMTPLELLAIKLPSSGDYPEYSEYLRACVKTVLDSRLPILRESYVGNSFRLNKQALGDVIVDSFQEQWLRELLATIPVYP